MQIRTISNTNKQDISFGRQRLFPIKLQYSLANGKIESIDGIFSKFDDTDEELAKKLLPNWRRTKYGNWIIQEFLHRKNLTSNISKEDYFLIECPKLGKGENSILALAQTSTTKNTIFLQYIQSARNKRTPIQVTGAGCGIMYGLTELAKKAQLKTINLVADSTRNAAWYRQLGFTQDSPRSYAFTLRANQFSKLQKSIVDKFQY